MYAKTTCDLWYTHMCTTCYCYHCGAYILVKRRQEELQTVCKHFLSKAAPDTVSVTTVDRLGLDLRVKVRDLTDEFRIGFRQPVSEHTVTAATKATAGCMHQKFGVALFSNVLF